MSVRDSDAHADCRAYVIGCHPSDVCMYVCVCSANCCLPFGELASGEKCFFFVFLFIYLKCIRVTG